MKPSDTSLDFFLEIKCKCCTLNVTPQNVMLLQALNMRRLKVKVIKSAVNGAEEMRPCQRLTEK